MRSVRRSFRGPVAGSWLPLSVIALVSLVALSAASSASAQIWSIPASSSPGLLSHHAMAYDTEHGEVFVSGGWGRSSLSGLTPPWGGSSYSGWWWSRSGGTWRARSPSPRTQPSPRMDHGLAYHERNKAMIVFGGRAHARGIRLFGDTWRWRTGSWQRQSPDTSPSPRWKHAMVGDPARRTVVLFGGAGPDGALGDTWEWNGTDWLSRTPANRPPPRSNHAMVYDLHRDRVILFGGMDRLDRKFNDTWEWDGTNWTERRPLTRPFARTGHAMAYHAPTRRVILFGGTRAMADTWAWDGTDWQQLNPAASPQGRGQHAMTYDAARARVVLFGGEVWGVRFGDTWEWDGTTWRQSMGSRHRPISQMRHAMCQGPDDQHVLLHGGLTYGGRVSGRTWAWDGRSWRRLVGRARRGPTRVDHAMACDTRRRRVVLFGGGPLGRGFVGSLSPDTWEWDGTDWRLISPPKSPPARGDHAMAFDEARNRVVMFGGSQGGFPLNDLWEWDGTRWVEIPIGDGGTERHHVDWPRARLDHAMVYDSKRARVVMFGGFSNATTFDDLWAWDGTRWTELEPDPPDGEAARVPPARGAHCMAYDSARDRVVVFGGHVRPAQIPWRIHGDTWEWDGTRWTSVPAQGPNALTFAAAAYLPPTGQVVLFGGFAGPRQLRQSTWVYPSGPASLVPFGAGCVGTSGVPVLSPPAAAGQLPWLGEAFTVQVDNLPPNMPALLLLGSSNQAWGPLTLPVGLAPIGMSGCTLYTSLDLVIPLENLGTQALLSIGLPRVAAAIGSSLFMQALAVDPGANPAGLILSNAAEAKLGAR